MLTRSTITRSPRPSMPSAAAREAGTAVVAMLPPFSEFWHEGSSSTSFDCWGWGLGQESAFVKRHAFSAAVLTEILEFNKLSSSKPSNR